MNDDLAELNLGELLARLEPLPEPPAISLWPQTEGWLIVGIALLACVGWLARRWLLQRRANAYRRAALEEIALAGRSPAALAEILRRTALVAFPRRQVAALYGEDWLAFLDQSYGGTAFRHGPGRALASAPYAATAEAAQLESLAADWVRHHRPEANQP